MPKLKSHSGVKKRIKISGSGKLIRNCCGNSHLATKKARGRKRRLKLKLAISKASRKAIKKLI
ncbi:MAG: 50S ribosomal protein L35 [bacterium]